MGGNPPLLSCFAIASICSRPSPTTKTPPEPPKPHRFRGPSCCPCGRPEPSGRMLPRTEHALARPVPSGRPSGTVGVRRRPGERPGSTGVPLLSAGEARPLHIPMVNALLLRDGARPCAADRSAQPCLEHALQVRPPSGLVCAAVFGAPQELLELASSAGEVT